MCYNIRNNVIGSKRHPIEWCRGVFSFGGRIPIKVEIIRIINPEKLVSAKTKQVINVMTIITKSW